MERDRINLQTYWHGHRLASHTLRCCSASCSGQGKVCARKWVKFREKRKVPSLGQVQLLGETFSSFLALLSQPEPALETDSLPSRSTPFTGLRCQAVLWHEWCSRSRRSYMLKGSVTPEAMIDTSTFLLIFWEVNMAVTHTFTCVSTFAMWMFLFFSLLSNIIFTAQ